MLVACGGSLVTIAELPVYPDAKELAAGESAIGNTLQKNMSQDAALRQTAGAGGKTEQRGFTLPADASWERSTRFIPKNSRRRAGRKASVGQAGTSPARCSRLSTSPTMPFKPGCFSRNLDTLGHPRGEPDGQWAGAADFVAVNPLTDQVSSNSEVDDTFAFGHHSALRHVAM